MPYQFLSDEWFTEVDRLIAAAGDLQIPPAMKAVEVNVTVTSPGGNTVVAHEGWPVHARTSGQRRDEPHDRVRTRSQDLRRRRFRRGKMQAFLEGKMQVEGDLAKLVAMQTVEPSEPQKRLTKQIAAITA